MRTVCPIQRRCIEAKAISEQLDRLGAAVPVTAAKSYCGNLGAGSAVLEIALSLLAIQHGQLFPIRNLQQLRPEAQWQPAQRGSSAGDAFVHISYTGQGQAACLVIGK